MPEYSIEEAPKTYHAARKNEFGEEVWQQVIGNELKLEVCGDHRFFCYQFQGEGHYVCELNSGYSLNSAPRDTRDLAIEASLKNFKHYGYAKFSELIVGRIRVFGIAPEPKEFIEASS